MATITVSTDQDYSNLSVSNDDLVVVTASARLNIDESTIDIRRWDCITDGEFYCENTSTTTPRFIHVGATGSSPRIRLEAGGRLITRGAAISIGTSDGTANQTFTLPTDSGEEYQLLGGLFVEMPTSDQLRDGTDVPRLMARIDDFTDTFSHERIGAVFTHDVGTNQITLGDGFNGWIPPNGAELFIPNIQIKCTNTSTAKPIFDLALSGRLDLQYTSIGGTDAVANDNGYINPDFDNGAGQKVDHVVMETRSNNAVNFNINAGKVQLSNVVLHCDKELIVSNAAVPPSVKNLFIMTRYALNNDYQLECFSNSGGDFENIVILAPFMSNGSASRGGWAGTSSNVDIYNIWIASPNNGVYFTTGSVNCKAENVYVNGSGKRGFVPATKTAGVRCNVATGAVFKNIQTMLTPAEGLTAHKEAIVYNTYAAGTTVDGVIWDANGQTDHVCNDTGSNLRINDVTIDGQLLNRVGELGTTSNGMAMTNVKFSSTQSNNTNTEFGFATSYNQVMIKNTTTAAVGTGTDNTSHHYFINEDDEVGRLEMRMSPQLNETEYYTEVIKTGKIVFNQNNRMYIENAGDQVILTSKVHGGILDFTSATKTGSTSGNFTVDCSLRRPGGTWTGWLTHSSVNMTTHLNSLPADPDNYVQVRYRITKNVTNLTNYLSYIYSNTEVDNAFVYPFILSPATFELTGLGANTCVTVYDASDHSKIIATGDVTGTFSFEYDGGALGGTAVDIAVLSLNEQNIYLDDFILPSSSSSVPIAQVIDRQYEST